MKLDQAGGIINSGGKGFTVRKGFCCFHFLFTYLTLVYSFLLWLHNPIKVYAELYKLHFKLPLGQKNNFFTAFSFLSKAFSGILASLGFTGEVNTGGYPVYESEYIQNVAVFFLKLEHHFS